MESHCTKNLQPVFIFPQFVFKIHIIFWYTLVDGKHSKLLNYIAQQFFQKGYIRNKLLKFFNIKKDLDFTIKLKYQLGKIKNSCLKAFFLQNFFDPGSLTSHIYQISVWFLSLCTLFLSFFSFSLEAFRIFYWTLNHHMSVKQDG